MGIAIAKPFATDLWVGVDAAEHGEGINMQSRRTSCMWNTKILRQKELLLCMTPQEASSGLAVLVMPMAWLCAEQQLAKRGTGSCQKKSFLCSQSPTQAGAGQPRPAARGLGPPRVLEELGELKQLSGAQSGATALALKGWGRRG